MSEETKPTSVNSLLDEVKAERLALDKLRAEAKAEADRLEQLRAEMLLSGSAGVRKEPEPPKPLTPKEYAAQLSKGIVPKEL